MSDWQPIKSAPTEGRFLVWDTRLSRVTVTTRYGNPYEDWDDGDAAEHDRHMTPTHWMPLPEPPQ